MKWWERLLIVLAIAIFFLVLFLILTMFPVK
jgi:hypothetical protein